MRGTKGALAQDLPAQALPRAPLPPLSWLPQQSSSALTVSSDPHPPKAVQEHRHLMCNKGCMPNIYKELLKINDDKEGKWKK